MMDLQGEFLIAMPQLEDYFQNTVVYMCEHNEQGSMGLVINQPTDLSIAELYSKMNFMMKNDRTFSNELVLAGGPVHSERGFILHKKTAKEFEHSYKITDEMYLTTSADIVETFGSADAPEKYLVAQVGQPGSLNKRLQIMRGWSRQRQTPFCLKPFMKIVILQRINY